MVNSFRDVIAACGGITEMALAVGAKPSSVEKWKQRDRIPSEYWQSAIEAARARGNLISADMLARIAAKPSLAPAELTDGNAASA